MFGNLKDRVNDLEMNLRELENTVYDSIRKVNNLYKKDYHEYERPKVDLLADNLGDFETNVWNRMDELKKRIEKLEEEYTNE